ncbi:hypothetical protein HK405_013058, partial [Cladochytrium tenue]
MSQPSPLLRLPLQPPPSSTSDAYSFWPLSPTATAANTAAATADPASPQVSLPTAADPANVGTQPVTSTAASSAAASSRGSLDILLQDLRSRLSLDHATSASAENMPPPRPQALQALRVPPPSTAATAASSSYAGFYPTTSSSSGSVSAYSSRSLPRPSRTSFDDDEDMNLSVAQLAARLGAWSGQLDKLSASPRETRVWRRRFVVLADACLYLFRSSHPADLPLAILALSPSAAVDHCPDPPGGAAWAFTVSSAAAVDAAIPPQAW